MLWPLWWLWVAQRIDPALETRFGQRPKELVRVIVRVRGDTALASMRLNELGCTVERQYQLIPAIAVSCSAQKALALLTEEWVSSVEEDRLVSAQPGNQAHET